MPFFGIAWTFISGGLGKIIAGLGNAIVWLFKNPAILFAVAFSIAFLVTVWSKNDQIAAITKVSNAKDVSITALKLALKQSRENAKALGISLDEQSASILALKTQGDSQDKKFDQLIAGQAAGNASIAKKIATIDSAKPGADKCQSAFDLVRSSVQ